MSNFRVKGDKGDIIFSGTANTAGQLSSRYMSLDTGAALNFFRRVSILKSDIMSNSLGLFSFMKIGRKNKVRFASLSTPKHLLSARKSGCVFTPKGNVDMSSDSIEVEPIVYQGKQCPDVFYGECLESIYGTGNDIKDMFATEEGRILLGELLSRIYEGLGNSFYDLVWYGRHPLIQDANDNNWYTCEDNEWADYIDQQASLGGVMTIIDKLAEEGEKNFALGIPRADISNSGEEFIGTATDLFDRVLKNRPSVMKLSSKNKSGQASVILVSSSIFEKYEQELMVQWNQIPVMLQYFFNGKFCQEAGCDGKIAVEGALRYKGHVVVSMDDWDSFDTLTGTKTYRCLAVAPKVIGLAYDVDKLNQFEGLGLRLTQHLDAPFQGQVYMDANFKLGVGLVNNNFIVNASRTLVPNV